jgi:hypothetical protein
VYGPFPRVKTLRDIRAARVGRTRRKIGNTTQLCEDVRSLDTIEFLEETAFGPSQNRSRVTPKGLQSIASGRVVGKPETEDSAFSPWNESGGDDTSTSLPDRHDFFRQADEPQQRKSAAFLPR